jgi:hypothetical protein
MTEWWVAGRPMPGEEESGDKWVALTSPTATLLAVIDGLGHGSEAAAAARIAADHLESHFSQPIEDLLEGCHRALRKTRGVAMAVAEIDARGRMQWLAVGNVDGRVVRGPWSREGREAVVQRSGVVGYQLPTLRARSVDLSPGDLIVMATDGIGSDYTIELGRGPVDQAADRVLAGHARPNDDALIMVARYREGGP